MPGGKRKLLQLLTGGLKVTGSASLLSDVALEGTNTVTGDITVGGATSYTTFSASDGTAPGRQTMAGTARILKDIFVRPSDFRNAASSENDAILRSACILLDVSASIFAGTAGSSMAVEALMASAVQASKYSATTVIPVPPDAATTGSIVPIVDYVLAEEQDTAGSMAALYLGAAYLQATGGKSSCPIRTAVCVEYGACYALAASGEVQTSCLPAIPSFGANDKLLAIQLGYDVANASDTAGSGMAILGLRLRYVSDKLGTQSPD